MHIKNNIKLGVDKSSLVRRAVRDPFKIGCITTTTIGVDFENFNIKIDNKVIKLQIWDTCGEENYYSLSRSRIYRGFSLAIFVYAINE